MVLLLLGAAALTAVLVLPFWGWRRTVFAAVLLTLSIAPIPLVYFGDRSDPYIVGVAAPFVTITTATVAVVIAFVTTLSVQVSAKAWAPLWILISYVLFCGVFVWVAAPTVLSGVSHVLLACAAWYVGVALSGFAHAQSSQALFVARLIVVVSSVLSLPSWYQWSIGVGAEGYGERTNGIFGHPATAGKIAVFMICILLPLMESMDRRVRRTSLLAIMIAVSAVFPALSRANILAVVIVVLGWFVLNLRRYGVTRFVGVIIVLGLVSVPFLDALIQRFIDDPEGTGRPALTEAALRNIPSHLWFGMGPNNYVATLQEVDPVVASLGAPVHNIFLLIPAEVGIVGVLASVPILWVIVRPALRYAGKGSSVPYARALLLLVFSVAFIGYTGWGVLRAPIGQLVAFLGGVLWGLATDEGSSRVFLVPSAAGVNDMPHRFTKVNRSTQ